MDYDKQRWPFSVINEDGAPKYEVLSQDQKVIYSPEQISAAILIEMKDIAENYLDEEVTEAVITVPAHFTDSQRQATKDAAEIAGLKVLRLINEPTAAAIAYGLEETVTAEQNILVFDMGGGTFDVSVLATDGEMYDVKAVGGDTHLGGEDFNNKLLDYFMAEITEKFALDISVHKNVISELLKQCELAKIALSTALIAEVQIDLPDGKSFLSSITRARFEGLIEEFFDAAIKIVDDTIKEANLTKADIQEIVMVGGSTHIPKIQNMIREYFDGKAINRSIKPDEAVAYGAALVASLLGEDGSNQDNMVLLDVIPHSLGIEYGGCLFHKVIKRNTQIPLKVVSERYSTSRDNQSSVSIKIYEGEHKLAAENRLLGRFRLNGFPKARARQLRIQVTFEIDADGILTVHGKETSSGVENMIQVDVNKDGLGVTEEQKAFDAEKFAAEREARVRLYKIRQNLKIKERNFSRLVAFMMNS